MLTLVPSYELYTVKSSRADFRSSPPAVEERSVLGEAIAERVGILILLNAFFVT